MRTSRNPLIQRVSSTWRVQFQNPFPLKGFVVCMQSLRILPGLAERGCFLLDRTGEEIPRLTLIDPPRNLIEALRWQGVTSLAVACGMLYIFQRSWLRWCCSRLNPHRAFICREATCILGEGMDPVHESELDLTVELVKIFEEVTGRSPLLPSTSLFQELGAGSMQAVSIAAAIKDRLGKTIPTALLSRHDTAEKLVAYFKLSGSSLDEAHAALGASVEPLRSTGRKRALFLVRGAGNDGGRFMFLPLVRQLDVNRPVYVFVNRPLFDGSRPYRTIEAMAQEYVTSLRAVQAQGPYLLAGWCLGASVAFEMAMVLRKQGESISLLTFFDPGPGGSPLWPVRNAFLAFQRTSLRFRSSVPLLSKILPRHWIQQAPGWATRLAAVSYIDPQNDSVDLIQFVFPGQFDRASLAALTPPKRWEYVYERLKTEPAPERSSIPPDVVEFRRAAAYVAHDHSLIARYRPTGVYDGRIDFFNTRVGTTPMRQWTRLCVEPPSVYEFDIKSTPRNQDPHDALMDEENVSLFVQQFQQLIDRADPDG
jgi:acyl carrier protein